MFNFDSFSFRKKLVLLGIALTLIPAVVTAVAIWRQNQAILAEVHSSSLDLAEADLKLLVSGIYERCDSNLALLERGLRTELRVARLTLEHAGQARVDQRTTVTWKAKNQFSGDEISITLPRMLIGSAWLGQVSEAATPAPVVDEVTALTGAKATIFQRLNAAGDMLRVATTVIGKDGHRAIGTYIPAVSPDGKPNAVVRTVLDGKQYVGRAFVVNAWYATAYEPLYGAGQGSRRHAFHRRTGKHCGRPAPPTMSSRRRSPKPGTSSPSTPLERTKATTPSRKTASATAKISGISRTATASTSLAISASGP
jgi:methyl-accepting chemotaxis protein